jgi:hypothetical protein
VADFAGLAVLLELFRQLAESGLLKLLWALHINYKG